METVSTSCTLQSQGVHVIITSTKQCYADSHFVFSIWTLSTAYTCILSLLKYSASNAPFGTIILKIEPCLIYFSLSESLGSRFLVCK